MDGELQTRLIDLKVSGDTAGFALLVAGYADGIEKEALALLQDGGTDQFEQALQLLRLIERGTFEAPTTALAAADKRLAELAVQAAELFPLDSSRVSTATQYADRFPEFSARIAQVKLTAVALANDEVEKWRAHKPASLPDALPALLRVSLDGTSIETSKGFSVPVSVVAHIWQLTQRARSQDRLLTTEDFIAEGTAIGSFSLLQVDADGSIVVSCHTLSSVEVDGIFNALGFT